MKKSQFDLITKELDKKGNEFLRIPFTKFKVLSLADINKSAFINRTADDIYIKIKLPTRKKF